VKHGFEGNAADFSIALAGFGLGGLAGAIGLLGVRFDRDRRRITSWFAIIYGWVLILTAFDPWLLALPVLLVIAGLSMTISNTTANSLLQAMAPSQLLGRTVSLHMLAIRGGLSLGSLLTGLSAQVVGVRQALMINGILAIGAQVLCARLWPGGRWWAPKTSPSVQSIG
jgi:predicted MFS family arabinose efflux permease